MTPDAPDPVVHLELRTANLPRACSFYTRLPYVQVADVADATDRARLLGASVLLPSREGPAGWRSVLAAPAGATFALWQPKA